MKFSILGCLTLKGKATVHHLRYMINLNYVRKILLVEHSISNQKGIFETLDLIKLEFKHAYVHRLSADHTQLPLLYESLPCQFNA